MDFGGFVQGARLWGRDPGPQSAALIRNLKSQSPETIIDLYEQATERASVLFRTWRQRPEPRALFDAHNTPDDEEDPHDSDPSAPPLLGRQSEPVPLDYDDWLFGWCFHQILTGNDPPSSDYHFVAQPDRPAVFDFFEGMFANGLKHDFQDAYERSAEKPWPLAPREKDNKFLFYNEQREHAPYLVQLYRATAREVEMDMNASQMWRQWWLSGPLRSLQFGIAESHDYGWPSPGEAPMHTGETPTSTRMRKLGLTVTAKITPNLNRILTTEEPDIRRLIIEDMSILLLKVHTKYGFTRDMPLHVPEQDVDETSPKTDPAGQQQ